MYNLAVDEFNECVGTYIQEMQRQLQEHTDGLKRIVFDIIMALEKARMDGQNIFIAGNGGSGACAQHLANDLNKFPNDKLPDEWRFGAISLVDNVALCTAIANDISYDLIFVEQLKNLSDAGDILFCISGSGNSENVVYAAKWAQDHRMKVISIVGFDGGELLKYSDLSMYFHCYDMTMFENLSTFICHLIVDLIRKIN